MLLNLRDADKTQFRKMAKKRSPERRRRTAATTHGPNFTVVDGGVPVDAGAGTRLAIWRH